MSILPRYFRNLDKTALRAVTVTLVLFAIVIGIFVAGKFGGFVDFEALQRALQSFADGPLGVPFLIFVFCLSAYIGVPQFALIAGAVVAFGPLWGAVWSWVATMCSGAVTFWTGRITGEATFKRYAGNTATRLSDFVGRNAFAASAIVRNVPTGPFIVVNMAFGVIGASFLGFWLGMAIGIVPKIAVVAFAGQGLMEAVTGNLWVAIGAAASAGGVWIALMLFARGRMTTTRQTVSEDSELAVDTPAAASEE